MSAPPQHDRLEIWRCVYARDSLLEASEAAKFLLANRSLCPPLQRAVVCHIVIAYARPFTKCKITASRTKTFLLDGEKAVPPEFQAQHHELLNMRNWAIGHKDATAFPDATLLNKVLVRVSGGMVQMNAAVPTGIADSLLQDTVKLCRRLVADCCEAEIKKYISHFSGRDQGLYYLNLEESPSEWLVKKD
jgi:hypothetical protein